MVDIWPGVFERKYSNSKLDIKKKEYYVRSDHYIEVLSSGRVLGSLCLEENERLFLF